MDSDDELDERQRKMREQANLDQATGFITNTLPLMWRGMFTNLMSEGFTEDQALALVKTYIMSQGSNDRKAP